MAAVKKYLASLGWKRDVDFEGRPCYISPGSESQVRFSGGWWILGRFTDSDIDGVAVGRYRETDEGQTLNELIEAGVA